MTVKITPHHAMTAEDKDSFDALLVLMQMHGWGRLLLHYTDGSVLMRYPNDDDLPSPPPKKEEPS